VPIPSWRSDIAAPIRRARPASAPARTATPAETRPSRTDGNGWVTRSLAERRIAAPGGASDVDELVGVRDEVVDQPRPAVTDLRSDPGNEHVERDRRHHQAAFGIASHRRRRSAAGSEHPFETGIVEPGRLLEPPDDRADAAPDGDIAHQLGR